MSGEDVVSRPSSDSTCLQNIRHLCPFLSTAVINTYRSCPRLYVDGEMVHSSEGITQGDLLSMAMYGLEVLPLIEGVSMADIIQTWFADASSGAGRLRAVRACWDSLSSLGEAYGYHLNPTKSILLVKPDRYHEALDLFADTAVQVRMDGCRHLSAALGTAPFIEEYLADRLSGFLGQLNKLCEFAESQPQAANHALVNGLQSKWTFLCRTVEGAAEALKPLEEAIHHKLLPMVTGYHPNEM